MVISKPSEEAHQFTIYLFFVSVNPIIVRQLCGGGINKYSIEVLMHGGYRVGYLRGRHVSWLLVHHHRVGGVTTTEAWVGLGVDFENPSIESILSCVVPSNLNTIWDSMSNLKTGGISAPQGLSMKDRRGYN